MYSAKHPLVLPRLARPGAGQPTAQMSSGAKLLLCAYYGLMLVEGVVCFRREALAWMAPVLAVQCFLCGPMLYFAVRRPALKWAALFVAQLGLSYGLSYFFIERWEIWNRPVEVDGATIVSGMAVAAIGISSACLAIVALHGVGPSFQSRSPRVSFAPLWGSWEWWMISLLATLFVDQFFGLTSILGFFGIIIPKWPIFAIVALDILVRDGRAPRNLLWVIWGVVLPMRIVLNIGSAFSGFILNEGLLLLFYLTMRGIIRLNVKLLLGFSVLFFFAYFTRAYIRDEIWTAGSVASTRVGVAKDAIEGVSKNLGSGEYISGNFQKMMADRIGHYVLTAHMEVVAQTPEAIPYLYGRSYAQFFWAFVPRVLYPDKPTESWGQQYGHRYRLLAETDDFTSFNFPQLTEAYANGGIVVVILVMGGLGWMVGRLVVMTEMLDPRNPDILWLALPVLFSQLNQSFSNLTIALNGALYLVMILVIPAWISGKNSGLVRMPPPPPGAPAGSPPRQMAAPRPRRG